MRAFRLPKALATEPGAPLMLVAGTRLEALRLLPLLRALRAPGHGEGALLVDTGESGSAVRDTLREHGLAADLRLPGARGTSAAAFALLRLLLRVRPSLVVAGGASRSGLAAGIAARGAGIRSALLASSADQAPRWRWRLLAGLHTWFYLGRERPPIEPARGRAFLTGDPLYDLCREQSEALGANADAVAPRILIAAGWSADAGAATVTSLLTDAASSRIDWVAAPAPEEADIHPRLRRLGHLPHWRKLALLRRSQVLITDNALLALEARWFGRSVLWVGDTAAPQGCVPCPASELSAHVLAAIHGSLSPRPLLEDGRAAQRVAGHLLDCIDQHAFAGILTRPRTR